MVAKTVKSKAELARQILSGAKPSDNCVDTDGDDHEAFHVDTDEEEDWEWIYSDDPSEAANLTTGRGRKRKVSSMLQAALGSQIIGARRGKFECHLGDVVRLKADRNEIWTALICNFNEEEDDEAMGATFMWLSPSSEIRNEAKRKSDVLPVGLSERWMLSHC